MAIGPTSILAIQFKGGQFKGEIIAALVELVRTNTVRVIDAVAVRKDGAGKVETLEIEQLGANDLHVFDPLNAQITGLLSNHDIMDIALKLEPNSAAGLLVLEHIWAEHLGQAIVRAKGEIIMNQLLMPDVVEENLALISSIT